MLLNLVWHHAVPLQKDLGVGDLNPEIRSFGFRSFFFFTFFILLLKSQQKLDGLLGANY